MSDQLNEPGKVTIRPDVGLYRLFPSLRYSPWVALGEMVDNSIQSYIEHKEELNNLYDGKYQLSVDINFGGGENPTIQVIDNAAGIFTKDIERAFTPAMPPQTLTGIGQYGIGMKSSACWYSNYFTIRTRAIGEPNIRTVIFDIPKIISENIDELDIQLENAPHNKVHGTRIIMRNLHQPIPQAGAASRVRSYLKSMYRDFLKTEELSLTINGDKLEFTPTNWLVAPYWEKDKGPINDETHVWKKSFEIELNESFISDDPNAKPPSIRGEIGILEKGDTKKAGLALLWRRKVVQGAGNLADSPDDLYRPPAIFGSGNSFEKQRVIGEIDVSELKVTSFKDAVNWGEGQEEEALRKIKQILNQEPLPLLKMAKNYRALDTSNSAKKAIQNTLDEVVTTATEMILESFGTADSQFDSEEVNEIPEPERDEKVTVVKKNLVLVPHFDRNFQLEVKDHEADPQWLRVKSDNDRKLWIITINRSHPFMKSFSVDNPESFEPILRIALAIGIAEAHGLNSGYESASFLRIKVGELLGTFLSSRSDVDVTENEEE